MTVDSNKSGNAQSEYANQDLQSDSLGNAMHGKPFQKLYWQSLRELEKLAGLKSFCVFAAQWPPKIF